MPSTLFSARRRQRRFPGRDADLLGSLIVGLSLGSDGCMSETHGQGGRFSRPMKLVTGAE